MRSWLLLIGFMLLLAGPGCTRHSAITGPLMAPDPPPGTGITGTVADRNGMPAAGAYVYAYRSARSGLRGPADFEAAVGAGGHYLLDLVEGHYHLVDVDARVQYSYGTGSRLSATYHRTRGQGLNFRGTGGLYNQMGQTGFRNNSNMFVLNWAQNLARSSERALFLDAAISYQKDQSTNGVVDQDWWSSNRDPNAWFTFSDMEFMVDWDNFPIDDRLVQNIRVNNCQQGRDATRPEMGGCIPYLNRNDLDTGSQFRINPYGMPAANFPTTGLGNAGANLNEETRWTGRVNLAWQADRYNRIQVGGDFVSADAKIFTGNLLSQIFMDANIYSPSRIGLYVTDRLDLGDVVVDLGLRYDRMKSGVLYPRYAGRVFTDPARTGELTNAQTAEGTTIAQQCEAALP